MSMRRTTSASVIQRLTAPSPRLRSCSLMDFLRNAGKRPFVLGRTRLRRDAASAARAENTIAINDLSKPWRARSAPVLPGLLGPRGPIVPRARQRTGRQVDGRARAWSRPASADRSSRAPARASGIRRSGTWRSRGKPARAHCAPTTVAPCRRISTAECGPSARASERPSSGLATSRLLSPNSSR